MNQVLTRALALIGGSIVAAAALQSPADAAVPSGALWASPTGHGTTCSKAAPCTIEEGFSSLPDSSTLVLDPGSYGSEAAPVTVTLQADVTDHIEGEPGHRPPTIVSDVTSGSDALDAGNVSNLKLVDLGPGDGIVVAQGVMDHVTVFADTGEGAAACASLASLVTNSLCVNTGLQAYGLGVLTDSSTPVTVQATTAVDTRRQSVGIAAGNLSAHSNVAVSLIDDIAAGGSGGDVAGLTGIAAAGAKTTVQLSHCDAKRLVGTSSTHATITIHHNRTDITAAPKFVNAAADKFAERASSPTINRGVDNVLEGTTDVAGQRRVLGAAPDIGAYEFAQPPAGPRLTVLRATAHSIRLKVTVNPEGLPTRTLLTGHPATKRRHHTLTGDRRRSYDVTITRLKPHTRYRLELRATNSGGSARKAVHVSTS
jgi:hypothetical protein